VVACNFFGRRTLRTLVQNSVPGDTTIFVVTSYLKKNYKMHVTGYVQFTAPGSTAQRR